MHYKFLGMGGSLLLVIAGLILVFSISTIEYFEKQKENREATKSNKTNSLKFFLKLIGLIVAIAGVFFSNKNSSERTAELSVDLASIKQNVSKIGYSWDSITRQITPIVANVHLPTYGTIIKKLAPDSLYVQVQMTNLGPAIAENAKITFFILTYSGGKFIRRAVERNQDVGERLTPRESIFSSVNIRNHRAYLPSDTLFLYINYSWQNLNSENQIKDEFRMWDLESQIQLVGDSTMRQRIIAELKKN